VFSFEVRFWQSKEMAELHFLAARLRMKIESLSLLSNKPHPKVFSEGRSDHSLPMAQDSLSSQLNLQVDQLTMQTHTLERENGHEFANFV
jgi:hypothetical protein